MQKLRWVAVTVWFVLFSARADKCFAQPDQEWKLTTYGVRDGIRTVVEAMVQDSCGFIWLATHDGLMKYDGLHFTTYRNDSRDSFSIGGNYVTKLMIDRKGVLWAGLSTGVVARYESSTNRFYNFKIADKWQNPIQEQVSMLYADNNNNIWIGLSRNGLFRTSDNGISYRHFDIVPDTSTLYDAESIRIYNSAYAGLQDNNGVTWFATHDGLYYFNEKAEMMLPVRKPGFTTAGLRDDLFTSMLMDKTGTLWFGSWTGGLSSYNTNSGEWKNYRYQKLKSPTKNIITSLTFCSDDCIWLTSADEGFGYFDIEDAQFSIFLREKEYLASELPNLQSYQVMRDRNNNLWISHAKGLTKIEQRPRLFSFNRVPVAKSDNLQFYQIKKVWKDKKGRFELIATYYADGLQVKDLRTGQSSSVKIPLLASEEQLMLVEDMLEDHAGRIWVLTRDHLLEFDTTAKKLKINKVQPPKQDRSNQYASMLEDREGNLWIASFLKGVFVIDPDKGLLQHYFSLTDRDHFLPFNYVNAMTRDSRDRIWLASRRGGIRYFDPHKKILTAVNLQRDGDFYTNKVRTVIEDKQGYIWFGTEKGFVQTDPSQDFKVIAAYTAIDGVIGDIVTHAALDSTGKIWATTVSSIAMIDPVKRTVINYGEEDGYLNRHNVALDISRTENGHMIIPTTAGYFSFDPAYMRSGQGASLVQFTGFRVNDRLRNMSPGDTLRVFPGENFFSIDFSVVDFNNAPKIQYSYKLDGFNENWINAGNHGFASYTNLPGGFYRLRVKGGVSEIDENAPETQVVIQVIDPVVKRPWFIVTVAILLLVAFILMIRNRNKKIDEQRDQIEAEKTINYFATSMNDKKTVDDILWDVTKNCIGKMNFEDCVIYLLDEQDNTLVQKASYGPKTDENNRIISPLKLPVGKGIVGAVAASGKPELINDTSKDPRYVVDDKQRLSEITVPIVSDGKVLGIIDCEHSRKNFFNGRHLMMLTTIASLCANKIVRATAETERINAQHKLNEVQQRMRDMEMQALRAQMNPHFIFNCLNSINRYIIKSDQATASLYLTRFAKLIRLILDNSNSKNVILGNELEALKLYIEMESLRFEQKFTYHIEVDPHVNTDSIEVPPLIIQPYVENAIWHGLLHKKEAGHLSIRVSVKHGNLLECIIEDNGVGREKAREMKSKTATTRKSLGMKLTESRLSLLNSHATTHATVQIEDLVETPGVAMGTKVILNIPIEN